MTHSITQKEFERIRGFFNQASGIYLAYSKKVLVSGRLAKRLRVLGLSDFGAYMDHVESSAGAAERIHVIDLLTTNETHFFREPKHFEFLCQALESPNGTLQRNGCTVWSAACSTGEEPYSIAMLLTEVLGRRPWHILASDLSTKVLDEAKRAVYGPARAAEIPKDMAPKYCLFGTEEYEGMVLMDRSLRDRIEFMQINLMQPLPMVGPFDVVFLRNVLIYFDADAKRKIVDAVATRLKPGGLLFIGHSETLSGVSDKYTQAMPTIYVKK